MAEGSKYMRSKLQANSWDLGLQSIERCVTQNFLKCMGKVKMN